MYSGGQAVQNNLPGWDKYSIAGSPDARKEAARDQAKRDARTKERLARQGGPAPEAYTGAAGRNVMDSYKNYMGTLGGDPELGDLAGEFEKATTAYTPYAWQNAREFFDKAAPKEYESYKYDYDQGYGPITNTAFEYSRPDIEQVQDISGVPANIWDEISRGEEMSARQGFAGQRAEVARQLAAGGGGRQGMGAKLAANLGTAEEGAVSRARRDAAIQRAMQEVGIAQNTQALKATRGIQQAQLLSRTDELQAQELARKQGIDIEDARYRVGLNKARQEAEATEGKYTYEKGTERATTRTGLEQAYDKAKAAEAEKKYKADYSRRQDITGLKLTGHQQKQQDLAARRQAALSGGQLAQGAFSQIGSYDIQREPNRGSDEYKVGSSMASNQYNPQQQQPASPTMNWQTNYNKTAV